MRSSNWPRNIAPATDAAHAQRDDTRVTQGCGHVALDDAAGNALDDGGLADARLADQHRIVLLAAAKHRQHAANLAVTPSGGIELAIARLGGQVTPELVECRRLAMLVGALQLALCLSRAVLRLEAHWRLATALPHHPVEERPEQVALRAVARRIRQITSEHLFRALLAEVVLLTATIGYRIQADTSVIHLAAFALLHLSTYPSCW